MVDLPGVPGKMCDWDYVEADQVAMVGDSLAKDVIPATETGIEPIWLRSNSSSTAPPSIRTIKHLKELCMS